MNCKFCCTDNPEDAIFCKACGKRLDGLTVCEGCSANIPSDSVFCPYCGKNLQSQVSAPSPVPTQATTPTPAPTFITSEFAAASAVAAQPAGLQVKTTKRDLNKVLKYALPSAALIIALLSLIFVFFIGYVTSNYFAYDTSISRQTDKYDLLYYFGDAYKDLDKIFDSLDVQDKYYSDYFASTLEIPVALGTTVAALTLLAVCVLSVLAAVRSILCLAGKTQKTGGNLAIAAFFAYVAGVLALYAINNYYLKSQTSLGDVTIYTSAECSLDGTTRAGIALCSVFVIIYTGLNIVSRGRELLNVKSIVKSVLSLAGIAFTIAVVALCAAPAISFSSLNDDGNTSKFGVVYLLGNMAFACQNWDDSDLVLNQDEFTAYAIIAFVLFVITVVFATRALAGFSRKVCDGTCKAHLAVCVLFAVFALLYMVFTIVTGKEFLKAVEYLGSDPDDVSVSYTLPVVTFVLSVLALGVSIARCCLAEKKSKVVEADVLS